MGEIIMYKKYVLKNGLRVIFVPRESTEAMTALVMARVGSACEQDEEAGISHLVEHMIYKGAKKRKNQKEVAEYIESIGGEHNAFTGKFYTGFYVKVAKEYWREALDFLSDNVLNPLFPADELEKEKAVIVEEIKMYQDMPAEMCIELFEIAAFGKTNLGREIIGTEQSVNNVSRQKLYNYYQSYYQPKNMVVVISGGIEIDQKKMLCEIEKYFVFKTTDNTKNNYKINIEPQYLLSKNKKTEQSNLVVGFAAPNMQDPLWHTASLLAKIIGGGMSSRMFQQIREIQGLAYRVRTSTSNYLDGGMIATVAGVANEKWKEALEAIIFEYKKVAEKGVTEAEIIKAKKMIKGAIKINMEDSEEQAYDYAISELILDKISTSEEIIAKYEAVTKEDVDKIIKKYFCFDKLIISAIGPGITNEKITEVSNKFTK